MRAALIGLGLALGAAAPAMATPPAPAAPPAGPPVVLELFTSQGCSSCPPADALLGRLKASEADLLPLSLHVDYWNRIGWRDPFSSAAMTARQYHYADTFGDTAVYTPELVVGGLQGVVGSDADAVRAAIARARAALAQRPPIDLRLARAAEGISVAVGAGTGPARVLLLGYDDRHVTAVRSGENAGRSLTETNVVRSLLDLGTWSGAALSLHAAAPAGEHAAVLLQASNGAIVAAAAAP